MLASVNSVPLLLSVQSRFKSTGGKQVFVLNCGSSSIKYQLMEVSSKNEAPRVISKGLVERIGEASSPIKHEKYVAWHNGHPNVAFPLSTLPRGLEMRT